MAFSGVDFLFFFLPLFLLAQLLLPGKNVTYALFSLVFYFIGEGWYAAIVVFSVTINFFFGLWIDQQKLAFSRKVACGLGIAINLGSLFVFKYGGFFLHTMFAASPENWLTSLPLPLGISFFTFHAISYLVDVYRRNARAERSCVNLALYILMFPQLIAGPIVRFHTIAHQLTRRFVSVSDVQQGLLRFCVGMGQKVLLADALAGICDPLFTRWQTLSTQEAWLAVVSYSLQIFFDFGGYSNMAIGLGRITGFTLPENFDYPYISTSITEFWRRWHISLSLWLRDYLYIPLGGNRFGRRRTYRNLIIVFLLCGLWHGAAWTFIFWGVYHGTLLVIERIGFGRALTRLPKLLQHAYAMLAVMFGWILFRADNLGQAAVIMKTMLVPTSSSDVGVFAFLTGEEIAVLVSAMILATPLVPRLLCAFMAMPTKPRWRFSVISMGDGLSALTAFLIMFASSIKILSGAYSPFIYFRF